MVFQFKREFLGINNFRYVASDNDAEFAFVLRKPQSLSKFQYDSEGLDNNFCMDIEKIYRPVSDDGKVSKNLTANIYTDKNGEFQLLYCIERGRNIFVNIPYWSFSYKDINYKIYEVGLGKKGTYYCVYCNGETVAMIRRDPVIKKNQAFYQIYSQDYIPKETLIMLAAYFDLTKNYPEKESSRIVTMNTWQKDIKNKYDESFIPRIKQQDGITD